MLKTKIEEADCSGCGACVQICPRSALSFKTDGEGFAYPVLDEYACIDCGMCERVCPSKGGNADKFLNYPVFAKSFVHSSPGVLKSSSSGGAFTAIAEAFCDGNCAIFGARTDSRSRVRHDFVRDVGRIGVFRKSKYLQSDMGDCFVTAKKFLDSGMKVLFTGTPCQIAGLRLFLRKDYDRLLCVDVSCHGVGNSMLTEKYLSEKEAEYGKRIKKYDFRAKHKAMGLASSTYQAVEFEDGSSRFKAVDPLYAGFVKSLFCRTSCYNCKFMKTERMSDFTMADFWGVEDLDASLDHSNGCSLLLVNTEKASALLEKISKAGDMRGFPVDLAVRKNGPLSLHAPVNLADTGRGRFFELMEARGMLFALNACVGKAPLWKRALSFMLRPFPARVGSAVMNKVNRMF